jgi:hypothetical protein
MSGRNSRISGTRPFQAPPIDIISSFVPPEFLVYSWSYAVYNLHPKKYMFIIECFFRFHIPRKTFSLPPGVRATHVADHSYRVTADLEARYACTTALSNLHTEKNITAALCQQVQTFSVRNVATLVKWARCDNPFHL